MKPIEVAIATPANGRAGFPCPAAGVILMVVLIMATGCSTPGARSGSPPPVGRREFCCPVAARLLGQAEMQLQRSEFRAARETLDFARQFDPDNKEIAAARETVARILEHARDYDQGADWATLAPIIVREQTRLEVENHIESGRRFMQTHHYAAAAREFRRAVEKGTKGPDDLGMESEIEKAKRSAEGACRLREAEEARRGSKDPK